MSVRRGAVWLATVLTVLAGVVVGAAAPAAADEDRIGLKLPSRFTAGGSAGSVNVSVAKRTDGCVSVRTALGIWLPDLRADQVEIQVNVDGKWRGVSAHEGRDGVVASARTEPDKSRLCKGKSVSARYRVTFRDGAPVGQATIVAEAHTAGGDLVGRAVAARPVVARKGASPTPRTSSLSPTPSPTAEEPEEAEDLTSEPPPVAAGLPAATSTSSKGGGFFGISTMVMLFGAAMVAMGAVLLVLLLRRSRPDRDDPGGGGYPGGSHRFPPGPPTGGGGGGGDRTMILPKLPPTGSRY